MDETATTTMNAGSESSQFAYRPLSKLAIVCLVLGLLSAVALVTPALWIVPLVAVLSGAVAWKSTARGESAGFWFAVVGIVLASFWGAYAVAYHQVRLHGLKSSTRDYAVTWMQMVNGGEVDKALQFMSATKGDTKPPAVTYEEYYSEDPTRREALDDMLQRASIRTLVDHSGEMDYLRGNVKHYSKTTAVVSHVFRFTYEDEGQPQAQQIVVHLIGELTEAADTMEWFVGGVDLVGA